MLLPPVIKIKSPHQDGASGESIEFATVYLRLPYDVNEWIYLHVVYMTAKEVMELLQKSWSEFRRDLFLIGSSQTAFQEAESQQVTLDTMGVEFDQNGDLTDTEMREDDSNKTFSIKVVARMNGYIENRQKGCYLAVRNENLITTKNANEKECTFQFIWYAGLYPDQKKTTDGDDKSDIKEFMLMKHADSKKFVEVATGGSVYLQDKATSNDNIIDVNKKLEYVSKVDSRFFVHREEDKNRLLQPVHLQGYLLTVAETNTTELVCQRQFSFDMVDKNRGYEDRKTLFENTEQFHWRVKKSNEAVSSS